MSPAGRVLLAPGETSRYHYIPSLAAGAIFVFLFTLSTVIHIAQARHYRLRFMYFTATVAGLLEIIGWAARLDSHFSPKSLITFVLQTVLTITAPTFLIASYFMIFGEIIRRLGPCYSRIPTKMYTLLFCGADAIALTVQAAGGALASIAAGSTKPNANPNLGGNVMLGGIVFQFIALICFFILALEFVYRFLTEQPFQRDHNEPATGSYTLDSNMKQMLFSLAMGSVLIFIRAIYRTIELSNGWSGKIIATQAYFIAFDGTMITLAMFLMNAFHPGRLLGRYTTENLAAKEMPKKSYV